MHLLLFVCVNRIETVPIELPNDAIVGDIITRLWKTHQVINPRIYFQDSLMDETKLIADSGITNECLVECRSH